MTLLTPKELAAQFRMEPVTIRLWARQGKLPGAYKMGRDWRFDSVKVQKWFERTEQQPKVSSWRSTKEAKHIGYGFNGMGKTSDNRLEQILGLPH